MVIRRWSVAGAKLKPKGSSQEFKQTVMYDQGCFVPILLVKDNLPVPSLQIQFNNNNNNNNNYAFQVMMS